MFNKFIYDLDCDFEFFRSAYKFIVCIKFVSLFRFVFAFSPYLSLIPNLQKQVISVKQNISVWMPIQFVCGKKSSEAGVP